jgi:hypothetical protein
VVKKLRGDFFSMAQIKARIVAMSPSEIEAMANLDALLPAPPSPSPPPPPAPAPPIAAEPLASGSLLGSSGASKDLPAVGAQRLERIMLTPTLELVVHDDPGARLLAQQIVAYVAGRSSRASS